MPNTRKKHSVSHYDRLSTAKPIGKPYSEGVSRDSGMGGGGSTALPGR